ALVVEKRLDITALVQARLVVDDPAHAVIIDKGTIEYHAHYFTVEQPRQRVLGTGLGMRIEQPSPTPVLHDVDQSVAHVSDGAVELIARDAQMRERRSKHRRLRTDPRDRPTRRPLGRYALQ